MKNKHFDPSIWTILIILSILSIILGIFCICNFVNAEKNYTAPIYISKRFSIEKVSDDWEISGQLKNLTNKDIIIEHATINCTGESGRTTYSANYTMYNIIVPANSYVNINEKNLHSSLGYAKYSSAYFNTCTIDGVQYRPKYSSDGQHFEDMPNIRSGIIFLLFGITILVIYIYFKLKK